MGTNKLQAHLIFNGNLHFLEVPEIGTYKKIISLLENNRKIIQGKPLPLIEADSQTLWVSSGSEVDALPSELQEFTNTLFELLGKSVNIVLDVYDNSSSKGTIYKFKKSGVTTEGYRA